jgi:carbamate kinase
MTGHKTAVVALGGNAITNPNNEDTIANQFANTRRALDGVVQLAREGYNLVISHGNGPQVGNAILRVELARDKAPVLPLGVCVADTEGGMGYMIEQSLQNRLRKENIDRSVVTIITQMVVNADDPSVNNPTKYIGQFYTEEQAQKYSTSRGWQMKQDGSRGWRRVVPSPIPYRTVEAETIKSLVMNGTIVIAGGGGGIPVYEDKDGNLEGFDAVIDKDLASAVIGEEIGAEFLSILTSVDNVAINFGLENQKELDDVNLAQIKKYHADGHFPAGSMGPKIDAAIRFLENGGEMVTITSFKNAGKAIHGEAGTRIVAD